MIVSPPAGLPGVTEMAGGEHEGESGAGQRRLTSVLAAGADVVAAADDGAGGGVTVQSGWPGIGGVFVP